MLHISQEERLRIIKDRINQYDIRFPVSTLNKEIGEDMGNISKMLKGKKTISDNFFTSFIEKFPDAKDKKGGEGNQDQMLQSGEIEISLKEYIRDLQTDKRNLQRTIDTNLTAMMHMLTSLYRHDQVFHETILRSLSRLEGDNKDLVLEARSFEAQQQVQDSLMGSKQQDDTHRREQ